MVLLLAGQQGLFTSPKISDFTFAQSEEGDTTASGSEYTLSGQDQGDTTPSGAEYSIADQGDTTPSGPEYSIAPSCSAGNEGQDGSGCYTWMNCSDGTGYPQYHACTGGSSAAQPAAPAQVAPQVTVVSGRGECRNGRMHWVNIMSDGTEDVDPTANEYCSGSGTNAQIIPDPNQAVQAVQTQAQPAQGGLSCEPGTPLNTCGDSVGAGHTYCRWGANGNYESECIIEACHSGTKAPPQCVADLVSGGNANSQWQCERDIAAGRPTCTDNITFCEDTGSNQSTIFLKRSGACNPALQEADSRGCIFYHEPVQFQNFACGGQPSQPQQPVQPQTPVVAQTCYVCDNTGYADGQGRWRVDGNGCPSNPPVCVANNSNTFAGCIGAVAGQICEARATTTTTTPVCKSDGSCNVSTPAVCGRTSVGVDNCGRSCSRSSAVCAIPPQGGNNTVNPVITFNPVITNNPTVTNTNSNTNTITNNVTREIVRQVSAPATFGNVGIGQTAYTTYTAPVQYTALPKTGLPELAWSALAFIPTGFGLRRFAKVKKALENHPQFIWEERQFKA